VLYSMCCYAMVCYDVHGMDMGMDMDTDMGGVLSAVLYVLLWYGML
jgi:hypothetical protein